MLLGTICALEHLCTNRQPNICAQTVDEYFGVSLLTVCAQTVDRYIETKRKRKLNENKENNTFGECKQLSLEKNPYIGQLTVVRCFSAQTVAWDLYPFAVRTSDVLLLSVYCPNFFAV